MPSKTPRQARAMRAAAAGKSTIGIPQDVGKKYVRHDKKTKPTSMKAGHGRTTARRGNRRSR